MHTIRHITISWEVYPDISLLRTPTGQFTLLYNHRRLHTRVITLPPSTKLWFSHRWSVVRQLLGLRQGSPLGRRCNLCLGKTAACLKLSTHNSCAAAALRHLVTSMPKIRHWTTFIHLPSHNYKISSEEDATWLNSPGWTTDGTLKTYPGRNVGKTAVLTKTKRC